MRYCMNFYLKWRRNYTWSKLELRYLLNKKQTSNFDHAQFLRQLRQKFIQYLILKLQSIVKKGGKGQRMFAFLCSKIALCSWDFQYIKWALLQQNLQALQSNDLDLPHPNKGRWEVSENVKYIAVTSRASKLPISKVGLF